MFELFLRGFGVRGYFKVGVFEGIYCSSVEIARYEEDERNEIRMIICGS